MMRATFTTVLTTVLLGGLVAPTLADPKPAPAAKAAPAASAADKEHAADLAKAADAAAEVANLPPTADLAKAADATADVANVPAAGDPAAPAAPAPAKSSDDIDLASLGLDPASSANAFDDKLNIYGFADVGWIGEHWTDNILGIRQNSMGYFVGNLNLYFSKNITKRWRALAEVRFSFLPNDGSKADGTQISAVTTDVTDSSRVHSYGSTIIERAYVEYDLTDHLTLRAGHWLTPYGIWNVDHGSPAIIATQRPYIIGEQMIPEHQTGLELFGNYPLGDYKLNYFVTASNGRGDAEAQEDLDNDVAIGARAELETPFGIRLGGSFYEGKATSFPASAGATPPSFREIAYAGDVLYDHNGLRLQGEFIARQKKYDDGARPSNASGFAADGLDYGFYVLAGYRTSVAWNVMPYAYVESYRPSEVTYFQGVDDVNIGLNFRPTASLILKVQGAWAKFTKNPGLISDTGLYIGSAQAAWMF
jgi:hypothetical protein